MERIPNVGTLEAELASWERHLGAGHLSDKTITGYTYGVRQFERFLETHGLPTQTRDMERAQVEEFISNVLKRSKPWTAQTR